MVNPPEAQSCLSCGAALLRASDSGYAGQGSPRPAIPAPGSFSYGHDSAAASYQSELNAEENTSGWGQARPAPYWASGWTFAGAIPFGLFALYNGLQAYGLAGILLSVLGLPLVLLLWPFSIGYIVYIGFRGRELAWRSRRFADRRQYEQMMYSWNVAGAFSLVVVVVLYVLWIALVINSFGSSPLLFSGSYDPSCNT
jgi:hypothetical protein